MKRKILAVVLALVITFSIVGIWYYTSYPTISVGKLVASSSDNFEKEFFSRKEANDFVGGRKGGCSKILECLKGKRKTIYGHIWKYAS